MINILAKLINGALSYAPRKIIIDGKTIFNPSENLLKEQGYKDVETSEAPAVSTQTQQAVPSWKEQEDKIVQSWELKPAQPDPTAVLQEIQTQAVMEQIAESEDKTLGIQCMALFPVWGVMLTPGVSAACMAFSSVSVVTSSLLLARCRI